MAAPGNSPPHRPPPSTPGTPDRGAQGIVAEEVLEAWQGGSKQPAATPTSAQWSPVPSPNHNLGNIGTPNGGVVSVSSSVPDEVTDSPEHSAMYSEVRIATHRFQAARSRLLLQANVTTLLTGKPLQRSPPKASTHTPPAAAYRNPHEAFASPPPRPPPSVGLQRVNAVRRPEGEEEAPAAPAQAVREGAHAPESQRGSSQRGSSLRRSGALRAPSGMQLSPPKRVEILESANGSSKERRAGGDADVVDAEKAAQVLALLDNCAAMAAEAKGKPEEREVIKLLERTLEMQEAVLLRKAA